MEGLMRKDGVVWLIMMMVMVMVMCAVGGEPKLHKVGGKAGWKQDVNYTEWALHERFYVGDWLYFGFDKRYYTVFEVNKTNYEQCYDQDYIFNITRGGRDVFNLTDARPFYFISSGGYCFRGMKLAIDVEDFVPSPQPSPAKNGSPTITGSLNALLIMFVILLVWKNQY